jgi:hypothetical protein
VIKLHAAPSLATSSPQAQHLIRRLCRASWRPGYMPCDLVGWCSLGRVVALYFAVA